MAFKKYGFLMDTAGGDGGAGAGGAGAGAAGGAAGGDGAAGGAGAPAANFDWSTTVADEGVRGWVMAKGFKDPAALAQTALNQEKLLGVPADQIVRLPKDDNPDAWRAVHERLGMPKTAAEYNLPVPEGDKGEFAKVAADWMHKHGVSGKQARGIAEEWNAFQAEQTKAQTEQLQARDTEQIGKLRAEWGSQFDANTALVDKAATAFGMSTEALTALKQAMGPGEAMKFMHSIGSKLGVEGEFVGGEGKGGSTFSTPAAAQARIAQLQNDKAFAQRFNSKDPVTRQEARDEMSRLHKVAYPGDVQIGR